MEKRVRMYSAETIAKWFLEEEMDNADEDGEGVTNRKLQKLLYYAQGVHLAVTGERLFPEDILAWVQGPAVKEVYSKYKSFGENPIALDDPDPDSEQEQLDEETKKILRKVHSAFGQYTAWKLREMALAEPPWLEAERGAPISDQAMTDFFRDNYFEEEDGTPEEKARYILALVAAGAAVAFAAAAAIVNMRQSRFSFKKLLHI
jgi:uncharacterized phage-associated protein